MKKQTVSINLIVFIITLYVGCQLIADIGATRFIDIAGVVMPAGTFVFAVTFTLRDVIHKKLGKRWAQAVIVSSVLMNFIMAMYLFLVGTIQTPAFYQYSAEWTSIFSFVPSIVIGSMLAELVSQLIDTEVYHWHWSKFPNAPQWGRVLLSNAIALPIDSLVFSLLAFVVLPTIFGGQPIPFWDALLRVVSGSTLYKLAVTIFSIPLIYLIRSDMQEEHVTI